MDRTFKFLSLTSLLAISVVTSVTLTSTASAQSDEDHLGYDAIVDQLNRETNRASTSRAKASAVTPSASAFDDVWMHGGVGLTSFMQSVEFADGHKAELNQRGVQAALGIDLFSPYWMAEGTARSFGETGEGSIRSSVQEFELKVMHKDRLGKTLGYRAGIGLTGRYLTIKRDGEEPITFTTPSSVASAGVDFFLTNKFSVGADLNARTAMIGETLDRNSYDATLRVDAHF